MLQRLLRRFVAPVHTRDGRVRLVHARRLGALVAATTLVASIGAVIASSHPASATGTPSISLTASMPSETLYGEPTTVTLTATNGTATNGYNLSFNDKLPAGATLQTASPAPTRTLIDGSGRLVLIWENVSDLQAGTTQSITYSFLATTPSFHVADVVADTAGAYVNSDARFVPDFDSTTGSATTDVTGSGTATASTALKPFKVTKTEPSPEAELLRGVHDHKTVYTLKVENNAVLPTTGFVIDDYLPAGLEFLGCTAADNTAAGVEEYAGSGRIDTGFPTFTHPCVVPSTVTTVNVDPDGAGPLPLAVYTHVIWTAADLTAARANQAPSGSFTIDYAAAVPMHENALFPGGTATTGIQGSNLDNNTGALTSDEEALRNHSVATGTTGGVVSSAVGDATVTAEDLAVQKSVDVPTITQGGISAWTMHVETGEYAQNTSSIVMTDIAPDGLCVIAAGTPCTGAAAAPTPAPASVVGTGPTTVTWHLADLGANAVTSVVMRTKTNLAYSGSNPISTNDSWTNTVSMSGTATDIVNRAGTTADVGVVDASSAGQMAGGVTLTKEVSEPVAGTLTCGDGSAITWTTGTASTYRAGDRVCWRLRVNFENALDTLAVNLRDLLPAGHVYEGWQFGANNTVTPGSVSFTATGVPPTWSVPTVDAGSQVLEVVMASTIPAPTAADGDILGNLAKLSYQNTAGAVFQARDEADVDMSAPHVTLVKGVADVNGVATPGAPADNVVVRAGDTVTYNTVVSNTGSLAATAMSVRDILPTGITCADLTGTVSNGGVCAAGQINWSGLSVGAASSSTLHYDVIVPIAAAASQSYTNTAGVRQFQAATNTGTPETYVPANNIDGTLTPNTTAASDTSKILLPDPTISKSRTTSINETGNGATVATIGETISYGITVTVPAKTTVYNAGVTDTVSNRLSVTGGTAAATLDAGALPGTFTVGSTGNVVTLTFPVTYTNATASDKVFVVTFDAVVLDAAANDRDLTSIPNSASFVYQNQTGTPTTKAASVSTSVVEPNIHIDKTDTDADHTATPGETVNYNVAVTDPTATHVSNAYDVIIVDVVPLNLDPVLPIPNSGVWDPSAGVRTITWTVGTVAVGATVNLPYQVTVLDPLIANQSLQNTATVRASSMFGTVTGERDSTSPNGGGSQGYLATDSDALNGPKLSIVKVASPTTATLGQTITYTLNVTVPADVILHDVTVVDTPPSGMVYTATTSTSCAQGAGACSPAIPVTTIGSDGTRAAWYLGDLTTAATADRVVTIVYTAYAGAPLAKGANATNDAVVVGNRVDSIGATPSTPPDPASFDTTSTVAHAHVAIVEPVLTVDKDVVGQVADTDQRRAVPGQTLTFTVAVTNTGNSPAYAVKVNDTPDSRLELGTVAAGTGYTVDDGDPSDGSLAWTIAGPIAPGATVTITYSLRVPTTLDESDEISGAEMTNTVDIPSYLGVPVASRVVGNVYPDYDNVTPDTVQIELDLASIGNHVWWDRNHDGVQDAGEPGIPGVDMTVTYLGPNGVVGGGDDEAHTVTTDASGDYLVNHLPGGNYRVSVDTTDLPAGFAAVYDLDGGTVSPNSVWSGALAENGAKRDVDFGYNGTGSIGDTVWFDANGNGTLDAGEPGLAGVTVTVTWLGPDGVVGGGDDHAFTAATDTSGRYLVSGLPAGHYTVAVGAGTLPTGFTTQSGDPDATLDGASALTLAAGAPNLAQDFGYGGTGSIGDNVWFDRNGNGTRDSGDDGIPGATVTLMWFGPDGVAGGGDDATFTRTTDASGDYLFAHLPAGAYDVAVSGLPSDYVNTHDEDLNFDADTAVALADGANHLTANFGFRGATAVGDRVWWDRNADGMQDAGEPGIAGVQVTITFAGPNGTFGDGDDLAFTRTTDAAGAYLVTNTPQGEYTVAVTGGVPSGLTLTYDEDSGTTAPDATIAVTLGAVPHLTADFGYVGSGAIGDLVYLDLDHNGAFSAGDQPLGGVDVSLTWNGNDGAFGTADDITLHTTTDASGGYVFGALPKGNFRVLVDSSDLPAGVAPTADPDGGADDTSQVTLLTGQTNLNQDFGYGGTGSIGDTIWLDRNGNGTVDADEPGLPAVGVTLQWAGLDATFGTADDATSTTTTDLHGHYLFEHVVAGAYRVVVDSTDLPSGLTPTYDPDGGATNASALTLVAGASDLAQDFGYRGIASVGDRVWIDANHDGHQDPGEPAYVGLTVTVKSAGLDSTFGTADDYSLTLITDAHGNYLATGLPAGDVRVSYDAADLGSGYAPGSDLDGGDATTTHVPLANGDAPRNVDFGIRGTASLSDVVWNDRNADGIRDAGEVGIAGVTVTAVWHGPDGDVAVTVTTAADGSWSIHDLPPGRYSVTVTQSTVPAGFIPSTPVTAFVTLVAGAHASVHHGETPAASIGNHVWADQNRDGLADGSDAGIPHVVLELHNAAGTVVAMAVTNATGHYMFRGVVPGKYQVVVERSSLPAADPSEYADPDGTLDAKSTLRVGPGQADLEQDFGFGPGVAATAPLLPFTGAHALEGGAIGLALLALGALATVGTRRRRAMPLPGDGR